MKKPSVGLALEGLPFIAFSVLTTLTLALLDWEFLALCALILTFFVLNFFRDPERVVPDSPGVAVSPADGRVCKIERMIDPFSGEERLCVCVFMNVFNVHVNRAPVTGTIRRLLYHPGKFLNASLDKASTDNERNAVQIEGNDGSHWTVVQIAGLVARRIVCWAEPGDDLARGQRFGLIKFGSRLDLYLPQGYEIQVRTGEKVLAGQSILAAKTETSQ
ncbi:MAG: phosphatidylserine decarboxylase family protein [Deltaproteobacteria bacterium]|nr:phosphatidylserine decarboxylase family protein [Deltaproteobacteria bacterium]